jgi:hypothetical protein
VSSDVRDIVKYDQTIVDKDIGDCHRAAMATMMQVPFDEVPDTWAWGEGWGIKQYHWWEARGWELFYSLPDRAHRCQAPSGCVVGTVRSLCFEGMTHSVVLDKDTLELVHDPNFENRRESVSAEEIISVLIAVRLGEQAWT